jgi:hypothetical protein
MKQLFGCLVTLVLLAACTKNNDRDAKPKIRLEGVSPSRIVQGSADTVLIALHIEDGDADLYNDNQTQWIYVKDTARFPQSDPTTYLPPAVPDVLMNPANGFSGLYTIKLPGAFLTIEDTSLMEETMAYEIFIKDKAGNESNRVYTGKIILTK